MDDSLITKPYKFGGAGGWVNQRIDSKAVDKAFEIYRPVTSIVEPSKSFNDSKVPFEIPIKVPCKGSFLSSVKVPFKASANLFLKFLLRSLLKLLFRFQGMKSPLRCLSEYLLKYPFS